MKTCKRCQIEKPYTDFYRRSLDKEQYLGKCRLCIAELNQQNKDKRRSNYKKFIANNPDYKKLYREANHQEHVGYSRKHYRLNKESIIAKETQYRKNNLQRKLAGNLRNRLYCSIRNGAKVGSAVRDLGCSIEELKAYLESKFQLGMTWDNWTTDGWHIDHIIPLDAFDLSNRDQFIKACHYTNLQPMWYKLNLIKSNKVYLD